VGCGNENASVSTGEEISGNKVNVTVHNTQEDGGNEIGRYVEESIDVSDMIFHPSGVAKLDDGSLIIGNSNKEPIISKDNGETWEIIENNLTKELSEENYVTNLAIAGDGTYAIVYVKESDSNETNLKVFAQIVKEDGSKVDILLEDDAFHNDKVWFGPDNELFMTIDSIVYKVDTTTGKMSELFRTENDAEYVMFQDNFIFVLGYGGLTIYDVGTGKTIEDQVLTDFINEQYRFETLCNTDGTSYDYYMFPGESGIIYIAGNKGLYRHAINGSSVEQIIDGSLSLLSDPSKIIVSMMELENNEFLALFTDGKLVRFTYDATAPAVPNKKLKVFSLYEDELIKHAITLYQTSNPDMFVEYEVGIEEGSSITRDDALKTLNTTILSDEGPDLIFLDDMPVQSYITKDMLLDLTPYIDKELIFSNIKDAFTENGKTYVLPGQIQLPVILGDTEEIKDVTD
jgi:hypothetical protein